MLVIVLELSPVFWIQPVHAIGYEKRFNIELVVVVQPVVA